MAKYIHTNQLASELRLVDKVLPQLAHLAPEFQEPCSPSRFVQADASRETSMARIFDKPDGRPWDYVVNLGGETAWSQAPEIYKLRNVQLSVTLGREAARRGVKAFVEASTGMVYHSNRTPSTEGSKLKPWLKLAKAKLEAEQELSRIPGLNLVILRLAHVYGPYDSGFVAKVLCLARVYQEQQRELKWLWTEDLRINTVHVDDAVRAIWTAAEWRAHHAGIPSDVSTAPASGRRPSLLRSGASADSTAASVSSTTSVPSTNTSSSAGTAGGSTKPPIFNIVDHGSTSQGTLAAIISHVFHIKTGFHGSIISQFARLNMDAVVDDLNEDVLQPWADMLAARQARRERDSVDADADRDPNRAARRRSSTSSSPLTPFVEKELLKDADLSLDGKLFETVTGFTYRRDRIGVDDVREMVDSYERMGWWP